MAPQFRPGKGTSVLVGSRDMTGVLNDSSFDASAGTADVTCYGSDDQRFIPAQRNAQVGLSGLFDGSTGAGASISEAIAELAGSTSLVPITHYPDGGYANGRAARLTSGVLTGANVASPAANVVTAQTSFQGSGGPRLGWSMNPLQARTSTGVGTGVDTTTMQGVEDRRALGAVAHLHVTLVGVTTGSTFTVKVQHSDDNSAWSDLITFTDVTAASSLTASTGVASERKTTTTAVKQYVRETLSSITGTTNSITYAVSVASPA